MTRTLINLTARQLLGRWRALIMLLLALLPVLVAVIYRLGGDQDDAAEWTAGMLDVMALGLVLPLTALIFGTGALGAEIEDGTAVYLLTKPVERWRIVLVKIGVAAAATILITLPPLVVASVIALGGDEAALTPAFAVAVVAGAITYCALFVALRHPDEPGAADRAGLRLHLGGDPAAAVQRHEVGVRPPVHAGRRRPDSARPRRACWTRTWAA